MGVDDHCGLEVALAWHGMVKVLAPGQKCARWLLPELSALRCLGMAAVVTWLCAHDWRECCSFLAGDSVLGTLWAICLYPRCAL